MEKLTIKFWKRKCFLGYSMKFSYKFSVCFKISIFKKLILFLWLNSLCINIELFCFHKLTKNWYWKQKFRLFYKLFFLVNNKKINADFLPATDKSLALLPLELIDRPVYGSLWHWRLLRFFYYLKKKERLKLWLKHNFKKSICPL